MIRSIAFHPKAMNDINNNGRSSDLRPPRISFYVNIKDAKLMASGLPEKMSVTMVLAAIRRLQQRDCPGFTPDSLLIHIPEWYMRNRFGNKDNGNWNYYSIELV